MGMNARHTSTFLIVSSLLLPSIGYAEYLPYQRVQRLDQRKGYNHYQVPQETIQDVLARKAAQERAYEQAEDELLKEHTPPPPPALTEADVEAIIDRTAARRAGEAAAKKKAEDEAAKEEAGNPFGKIGGLGPVGGIGNVSGTGKSGSF